MNLTDLVKPKPRVAAFCDGQNFFTHEEEKRIDIEWLMAKLKSRGILDIARIYLGTNARHVKKLSTYHNLGFEVVTVPGDIDVRLAVDACRVLWTNKNIQEFVLVTGDKHFASLIRNIRSESKKVVLISREKPLHYSLKPIVNEIVLYP